MIEPQNFFTTLILHVSSPLIRCHDDIWSNHMVFKVLYFKSSAFHVVSFQIRMYYLFINKHVCMSNVDLMSI